MSTTFSLLGALSPQEQQGFLRSLVQTRHAEGEVLFCEGDPGDYMLLILEGTILLSRLAPSGEEIRLADAGPGNVVGEMAVLSPAPRSATATCQEETIVAWLARDTLLERQVLEDTASGVLLRMCTEQVCDRLLSIRVRADLLRDALDGGDRQSLSERIAELVGTENGPLPENLRKWLEGR